MAGVDFRSSPATAPSSPRRFGPCFFSAPASPSRMSEFYGKFDDFSAAMERSMSRGFGPVSAIPFDWEETPGTPKSAKAPIADSGDGFGFGFDFDFDFAFDVSEESEKSSRSAEELFDGGKIRPLKPPPRLQVAGLEEHSVPRVRNMCSPTMSPRSPIARGKRFFREALSPRGKKQSDPFPGIKKAEHETERNQDSSGSKWRRRITRSLSPFRAREFQGTERSSKGLSKKWGFKNFLVFRGLSDKNPLKRTALFSRNKRA